MRRLSRFTATLLLLLVSFVCAPALAEEPGPERSRAEADGADAADNASRGPAHLEGLLKARFQATAASVAGLFQMVLFRDDASGELASIALEPGFAAARVNLTYRF